jgi:RsmE family RNA methyltransferase
MNICLFTPEELERPLDLRDERARHLISVLHKGSGDSFAAGVVGGASGEALIERIEEKEMTAPNGKSYKGGELHFSFRATGDGKPLYPLTMLIGFPRPIQLKRLLRDMAGLGAGEVWLCGTDLVEKSYLKSTLCNEEECRKMLLEGSVQAASTHVPEVRLFPDLAAALQQVDAGRAGQAERTLRLAMDNVRPEQGLSSLLAGEGETLRGDGVRVVSAIGSERGWSDRERGLLEQEGFRLLSMGKRVLRTESAATVAASLILSAMGVL